jgi:hypothetical protein
MSAITITETDMNKARKKLMGNASGAEGSRADTEKAFERRLQTAIDEEVQPHQE